MTHVRKASARKPNRAATPVAALALVASIWPVTAMAQRFHDDEIRRLIVQESIARFSGDCPCPYSYAWNGRQCADNSAYMKRIPTAPYCYPQDVPPIEIYRWRRERGG